VASAAIFRLPSSSCMFCNSFGCSRFIWAMRFDVLPCDRLNAFWHILQVADVLPGSKYCHIKLFFSAILRCHLYDVCDKGLLRHEFYRPAMLKFAGLAQIGSNNRPIHKPWGVVTKCRSDHLRTTKSRVIASYDRPAFLICRVKTAHSRIGLVGGHA